MGQLHTTDSSLPHNKRLRSSIKLQQENWLVLQKPQENAQQLGSYVIYKNSVTGQIARGYSLVLQSQKAHSCYIEEFDYWRSELHWNVIESKYIIGAQDSYSLSQCCGNFYPAKIFVQNPVVTLAEIKDIPPPEGLYILLSALVGYQHLFEVFGYFWVKETMITINEQGIVKVWINPDLSKNRPLGIGLNQINISDMESPDRFIKQLVSLINTNIDYSQSADRFDEYLNKKHQKKRSLTFGNCRKHLLNFAQEMKFDLPDSLLSVLDLLFDKSNRTSMSHDDFMSQNELCTKNSMDKHFLSRQENHNFIGVQNVQSPTSHSHLPAHQSNYEIQSFHPDVNAQPMMRQSIDNYASKSDTYVQNNLPINHNSHSHLHIQNVNTKNQQHVNPFYSNSSTNLYPQLKQQNHANAKTNANYNPQQLYANNPYLTVVQPERFEKQSTIREEAEEESFLTSYKNSKFQPTRDYKRTSTHLQRHQRNIHSHRHTLSSQSDTKLNIQNMENYSPRQIQLNQLSGRHNEQSARNMISKESSSRNMISKEQSSKNMNQSESQKSMTKRSQKSIQFHTLNEVKQLDAEIAEDLENMLSGIRR